MCETSLLEVAPFLQKFHPGVCSKTNASPDPSLGLFPVQKHFLLLILEHKILSGLDATRIPMESHRQTPLLGTPLPGTPLLGTPPVPAPARVDSLNFRRMNNARSLVELVQHYDTWAPGYDAVSAQRSHRRSRVEAPRPLVPELDSRTTQRLKSPVQAVHGWMQG